MYITLADGICLPVKGHSAVCLSILDHHILLHDYLLVPALTTPLISIRRHRCVPGCCFLTINLDCYMTFPKFYLIIDDMVDCLIPISPAPLEDGPLDFDEQEFVADNHLLLKQALATIWLAMLMSTPTDSATSSTLSWEPSLELTLPPGVSLPPPSLWYVLEFSATLKHDSNSSCA